jgi:hypothetical protein
VSGGVFSFGKILTYAKEFPWKKGAQISQIWKKNFQIARFL